MRIFSTFMFVLSMLSIFLISFLSGCSKPTEAQSWLDFNDLKPGHWAEGAIYSAASNGMIKGFPDGTFQPNNNVKSVDFGTMLIRAYGHGDKTEPYPTGTLNYMKEMNFPHGNKDNLISRTEVAELVAGTKGYNLKGTDAIKYLLVEGLAKGKKTEPTVSSYAGNDMLTRAEAVVFIQRVMEKGTEGIKPNPSNPSDPKWIRDGYEKMLKDKGIAENINFKRPSTDQMKSAVHAEMVKMGFVIELQDNVSLRYNKNDSHVSYRNLNSGIQLGSGERNADSIDALTLMLKQLGFTDTTTVRHTLENKGVVDYSNATLRISHTTKGISVLIDEKR